MSLFLPPTRELDLFSELVQQVRSRSRRQAPDLRAVAALLAQRTGLRQVRLLVPGGAPQGWAELASSDPAPERADDGKGPWMELANEVARSGGPAWRPPASSLVPSRAPTGARAADAASDAVAAMIWLGVPIRLDGKIRGVLSAARWGDARTAPNDLRLLSIIAAVLAPAIEPRSGSRQARSLRPLPWVGTSRPMRQVLHLVRQVAPTSAAVLLLGERGVGKATLAEIIHSRSGRAHRLFLRVNCAGRTEAELEQELFGGGGDAGSGARGKLEKAQGGSLFLSDVDALPQPMQALLARLLTEGQCECAGDNQVRHLESRILAASTQPLEPLVRAGRFRSDLFYRLHVFPIQIAPLRERREDIPPLAHHFMEQQARAQRKCVRALSPGALHLMTEYPWPGNVRELHDCLHRAVLLSTDGMIHSWQVFPSKPEPSARAFTPSGNLTTVLATLEQDLIRDALQASAGRVAAAARLLGLTNRVLGLRMRKFGIAADPYRQSAGVVDKPTGAADANTRLTPPPRAPCPPKPACARG